MAMEDAQYLRNVEAIGEMVLKNAAHSYGLDFHIINETLFETTRRIKATTEATQELTP